MTNSPPQDNSWTQPTATSSTSDDMRSFLDEELALRCRGLLATLSLFSSAFGLVQGDDDPNIVVYEVMRNINTAILLLDNTSDPTRPAPPHMPRLAYETVRRMRESIAQAVVLTPLTSADAAGAADALSAKLFDDFLFDYLLLDISSANRQSVEEVHEAIKQTEATLPTEDRETLIEIRRNGLDFSLMARRLGISPDEGRIAFRLAANHLRDAYFHRKLSGNAAPLPSLVTTFNPSSAQQPDAEELEQIAREKALFRYIGALERHDHSLVGTILQEAETDPILEEMMLGINAKLEAYLFSEQRASSAPSAASRPSHPHEGPAEDLDLAADAAEATATTHLEAEPSFASTVVMELPIPFPTDGEGGGHRDKIASLFWLSATHILLDQTNEAVECLDDALRIALEIDDHVALATCAYWHAAFEYVVFQQYPDHFIMTQAYCFVGLKIAAEATRKGIPFDPSLRQRLAALERVARDQGINIVRPPTRKSSDSSQLPRRWGNLFLF